MAKIYENSTPKFHASLVYSSIALKILKNNSYGNIMKATAAQNKFLK